MLNRQMLPSHLRTIEKEERLMNELDNHAAKQSDPAVTYKAFVQQMSDWLNGGELPGTASQDLRFVLELQKQKLQSLGLNMKYELPGTGSGKINTGGISYSDRIFTNSIIGGYRNLARSIGGTQHLYTDDISLSAVIQDLKTGTQPCNDLALCCPHCGAPSTLGELQAGCKHCGTHFLMSELYPKVMNYFIFENHDSERQKRKNKRDLIRLITMCILPLTVIEIILSLLTKQDRSPIFSVLLGLFGGIFGGAMFGGILFVFKKLFEVFGLMGKGLRGGGHTVSTLLHANQIKKNDPEFSSEYFRDKIISLFRMAVYSKDAAELACCRCRCPETASDIIEAQLFNFNINSCRITDMVCDAEVTLYLDCLHCTNGKIINKSDKYVMHLRKRIKRPTELGFSFAAVSCPSCGASFDGRNVKACPYCHSAYLHEEHDWIVTDIK